MKVESSYLIFNFSTPHSLSIWQPSEYQHFNICFPHCPLLFPSYILSILEGIVMEAESTFAVWGLILKCLGLICISTSGIQQLSWWGWNQIFPHGRISFSKDQKGYSEEKKRLPPIFHGANILLVEAIKSLKKINIMKGQIVIRTT